MQMERFCTNLNCAYCKDGSCLLQKIHLDIDGVCQQRAVFSLGWKVCLPSSPFKTKPWQKTKGTTGKK